MLKYLMKGNYPVILSKVKDGNERESAVSCRRKK